MSLEIDISINNLPVLQKAIDNMAKSLPRKETRKVERQAARHYLRVVERIAPKASGVVKRYNTDKFLKKWRAPKGKGKVVARYTPGNLGRSFKLLPLKLTKGASLIGPIMRRRGKTTGNFNTKSMADGWYAHFISYTTKVSREGVANNYIQRAWSATQGLVVKTMFIGLEKKIIDAAFKR